MYYYVGFCKGRCGRILTIEQSKTAELCDKCQEKQKEKLSARIDRNDYLQIKVA